MGLRLRVRRRQHDLGHLVARVNATYSNLPKLRSSRCCGCFSTTLGSIATGVSETKLIALLLQQSVLKTNASLPSAARECTDNRLIVNEFDKFA